MYELALFAGAGGGILGGRLCGWTCIGACEIEEYPRKVLMQRQRDGTLPEFPIWDDIRTFRADNPECAEYFEFLRSIRGELVISGGFPCQDISLAGKGAGITGQRSGLWSEMARVIGEVRPAAVFVENSTALVRRGLARVVGNLTAMGYDDRRAELGADAVGLPHHRARLWLAADAASMRSDARIMLEARIQRESQGESGGLLGVSLCQKRWEASQGDEYTPVFCRNDDGIPHRVDRLKAIGNAQVPAVAALAWDVLRGGE